jgi:hypothetical protein
MYRISSSWVDMLIYYIILFEVMYLADTFLRADQNQQRVNICEEARVITGNKSWIYGYDPETKQQSSQWKSPNSLRLKELRQVKSKVKSMLIIFFDI